MKWHNEFRQVRQAADRDDEREFERLYRESYPLVYNFVRYQMGGDDAAEDVVADAYLQAARHFGSFDPQRARFSTWVVAIAKNSVNGYYRKARTNAALDDVPDSLTSVQGEQNVIEDRELIRQLMSVLDQDERELVFMKYFLGMRNVDIASELDMNVSTVSTKLARALSEMRRVAR